MIRNPDILKTLGAQKKHQYIVGFVLESEDELENSKKKLKEKKLDFIILNSLKDAGAGFDKDTNKIILINDKGETLPHRIKK
ncbi:phosphopantothenoylcysteine decarboxylase [Bacteroidetes bacterium endosymbiont of Geopemphigus sp.]|uniref:phosphopantothenoylcysteine decarboxylase domain-containing protein n=1 Tax=Bacteroidetes bacterium endosymbiont of Geopemphigus sp. TaxID=2047937 RepID=UPI0022444312|nr:phosphopantothenoylcysteine decarboxylase [Bacteroidetes bacterium endosymbiont of Geopemphigus sp.]